MNKTRYSIVIPAYNESARIHKTLQDVLAYAEQQCWSAEVIVVNDGSQDDTAEIVRTFATLHPTVRLLENPGNRGKGFSVRNGMLHASGDILLFTDADLSSPISEAPKLFHAIERGADIAIGSRWLQRELQSKKQPLYRQFFGRCFNVVLRLILRLDVADTQCGFKAFTREAAKRIFPVQKIERWGFDPELLFLGRRLGFSTAEISVQWAHDNRTKINYFRDGMRMLEEMFRVRWYAATGAYRDLRAQRENPVESGSDSAPVLRKKVV